MSSPFLRKHMEQIRAMWQSRALSVSEGKLQRVLMCVLAKEYAAGLPVLLKCTFPGFTDIQKPMIVSYAKIAPNGKLICDVIQKDDSRVQMAIYENKDQFIADCRKLADKLKLNDEDRRQMFGVLQRWVVADYRYGPNGEKLAS